MKEFILELLQAVIVVAVSVATTYLCKFLATKKEEIVTKTKNETSKTLLSEAFNAVGKAVTYTNQTYVDALKKSGTFSIENQKNAFRKSYNTALQIMSQEAKDFIDTAYGSLSNWLIPQIEAQIKNQKEGIVTFGEVIQ